MKKGWGNRDYKNVRNEIEDFDSENKRKHKGWNKDMCKRTKSYHVYDETDQTTINNLQRGMLIEYECINCGKKYTYWKPNDIIKTQANNSV